MRTPSFFVLFFFFLANYQGFSQGNCNLNITLVGTIPAKCFGTATGGLQTSVTGAAPPITFLLDGVTTYSSTNVLNSIPAGSHYYEVIDNNGCRDTVFFTITQPSEISILTSFSNALCHGANSGIANASATGGSGMGYTFQWQACGGGNVINGSTAANLYAGCYTVYVEDSGDCESSATVNIGEPPALNIVEDIDSVSCYGGSDGAISLSVSGGAAPYSYIWDVGQTTATASSLFAGYHEVTITDADGCNTVHIADIPQPAIFRVDSVQRVAPSCFGGLDAIATAFVSGGTAPFTYSWSVGGGTTNPLTGIGSGSYIVTVTDARGCTAMRNFVISAPAQINLSVSGIVHETCAGSCDGRANLAVSGGVGPYSILWVPAGNPPPNPAALCAGTYEVTATDSKGCTQTRTITINAGTQPVLTFIPQSPTCPSALNGRITTNIAGAILPITFNWSNGQTTQNLLNVDCGTYTLQVVDGKGCTSSEAVTLDCPPQMYVDSIVPVNNRCWGQANGRASVYPNGGTPPYTFLWSDPNGQNQASAVNLSANDYTVVITDANGCSITASTTILQPNELLGIAVPSHVACFGDATGSATVNTQGGVAPYSFRWNNDSTSQSILNLSAGNYAVTITDENGCTYNSPNISVNQPASPVSIVLNQTKTACNGENSGEATAIVTGGTGTNYQYTWSNGSTSSVASQLGTGDFTLIAQDINGCPDTALISIVQYDSIRANVAFSEPRCFGFNDGQAAINNVTGGAGAGNPNAYQYAWNIPNPPNATAITNLPSGNYTLTITDNQGCFRNYAFFLDQPTEIRFDLSIDSVRCFGENNGRIEITAILGDNPIQNVAWNTGANGQFVEGLTAGSYQVTATDSQGCISDSTIQVFQPEILRVQEVFQSGLKCANDPTGVLVASVAGGNVPYQLLWSNGTVGTTLVDIPAGAYSIIVTDSKGCTTEESASLVNPPGLNISFQATDLMCFGDKYGRVTTQVSGGLPPYRFSKDGQNFNNSSIFSGLEAGQHPIYVKDGNGCVSIDTAIIREPLPINVDLGPDVTLELGDSLLISPSIQNAIGDLLYMWSSADGGPYRCLDSLFCDEVFTKPAFTNHILLTVEDENGCRGSGKIRVEVQKMRGAFVPTAFSPNGDGANDILYVLGKGRQIAKLHTFRVFDRWGDMVFESTEMDPNNESIGWNGEINGKEAPLATYAWYLEVEYKDGFRQTLHGQTQLIR